MIDPYADLREAASARFKAMPAASLRCMWCGNYPDTPEHHYGCPGECPDCGQRRSSAVHLVDCYKEEGTQVSDIGKTVLEIQRLVERLGAQAGAARAGVENLNVTTVPNVTPEKQEAEPEVEIERVTLRVLAVRRLARLLEGDSWLDADYLEAFASALDTLGPNGADVLDYTVETTDE